MAVNLASGQSAITTDQYGVTHIVWVESGLLWHSTYDPNAQQWVNAEAITVIGNESVANLRLVTSAGLINNGAGGAPGLAVVYQQGTGNNSDFFYTAAQYGPNQTLQWLNAPVQLTQDQVGDLNPTVQVYQPTNLPGTSPSDNTASVVVVGEKVNIAANPSLSSQGTGAVTEAQEGGNLYNLSFTVNANQFTPADTALPPVPASYVPEDNLVQNGVIQGLPQYVVTPPPGAEAGSNPESLALATTASSQSYSKANHWNTALYYRTGGGGGDADLTPTGFIDGLTDSFMSRFFLQGLIKGSGNYNDTNLSLFLASRGVFQPYGGTRESGIDRLQRKGGRSSRGESAVALRVSLLESVNYRYSAPGALIPSFVANTVGTSIGVTFPIFEMDGLKVSFSGSVGFLSRFSGVPKSTAEIDTLGPIVGLLGAAAGTALIGAETYGLLASPLFSTQIGPARQTAPYIIAGLTTAGLVSFLADEGSYSNVDTTLYFPNFNGFLLGVAGVRGLNLNAQAGLFITFSDNLETGNIDLFWGLPMRVGVQLGPINVGFSYDPHWQWPIVQGNTDNSAEAALAFAEASADLTEAELGTASVAGALVSIDLGNALNTGAIPAPADFAVTETTPQGTITYSVVSVALNGSTVQLQLAQPIAPSSNTVYTSLDDPNPTVAPNPIQVTYTGSTLEYSDGSVVENFTDTAVNNTPETLTYTYNPLNGNSANYASSTSLIGAGLYFGDGTNTSSTNQILLVFNQAINGSPSAGDFTIQSNGVAYSVSSFTLSANTLLMTTTVPIPQGNPVLLNYTGNTLQGAQTNALPLLPFSNYAVKTSANLTPLGAVVASDNSLTIALNQETTSTPSAGDFTVQSNGVSVGVSGAVLENNMVTLTTEPTLSTAQSYTVVGTLGAEQSLSLVTPVTTTSLLPTVEGILGQESTPSLAPTSEGNQLLGSWIADAPPLTPIAGFVNGDQILLNFVSALKTGDSADNLTPGQFTVSLNGGPAFNPQTAQIENGNSILLQLANEVGASDVIQVAYAPLSENGLNSSSNPYLTDAQGTQLWLPNFTTYNPNLPATDLTPPAGTAVNPPTGIVISNVTGADTSGQSPTLLSAVSLVQDNQFNLLTLTFNALLAEQVPGTDEFSVTVNGQAYSVTTVGVYNNTVQLTVSPPANQPLMGQTTSVSVSYQGTTLAANSDYGGGAVQAFSSPVQTAPPSPTTVVKYALGPSGNSFADTPSAVPGVSGLNLDAVAGLDPQSQNNVIVWVNVDSSQIPTSLVPGQFYDDNQSTIINDSFQSSSVYYALAGEDNTWTLAAPIALNQTGSNNQLTLGLGPNNQLMAAWLNTQENNETTLYYALLNNGVWSAPEAILSGVDPDPLTNLVISQVGGQPAIFATQTVPASYSELTGEENPLVFFALDEPSGSTTATNTGILGSPVQGLYSDGVSLGQTGALWNPETETGDPNPAALFANGAGLTLANSLDVTVQSFSLDFWFKVEDLSQGALNLVSLNDLFNLGLDSSGTLELEILDTANPLTLTADAPTPVNQWNYVALTYAAQNDTVTLYLNGAPVAAQGNLTLGNPGSTTLTLAGTAGTSVYLDEVGLYDSALSYSALPTSLNDVDLATVTAAELQQIMFGQGSNDIGEKYAAQYNPPVPSGPDTQSVVWTGSAWSGQPQSVDPFVAPVPTVLSDANNPVWDVVSAAVSTASGAVFPNGLPDQQFTITLTNYQNNQIVGIEISAGGQNWVIGRNGNTPLSGNQLGVVQGTQLLNPLNPNQDSALNHWVLGTEETYYLFVDNNGAGQISNAEVTVYFADGSVSFNSLNSTDSTAPGATPTNTEPTNINPSQVLGIATVTEINDASLATIDSGFVINTNNPNIGYGITSGSFTQNTISLGNGQTAPQTDVVILSRGYTDGTGAVVNATAQILFGNGTVMQGSGVNPLTATDLSGNPGGVLITGLTDGGVANGDVALSLTTGDLDGDGYDELILGDANNNTVYILYGSYLNSLASNAQGTIIDFSSGAPTATPVDSAGQSTGNPTDLSASDYALLTAPSSAGNDSAFGYTLAVGNFDSGSGLDLAIGAPNQAPNQNSGQGAVYLTNYGAGSLTLDSVVLTTDDPSQTKAGFGAALAVSHYGGSGQASTFNGTEQDILFVGAPGYTVTITNAWNGLDGFSSSGQSIYPTTSTSATGAVYGFFVGDNGLDETADLLLVGPNTASPITGTGGNDLVGSSMTLADYNGDGSQDLAISAPGGNNTNGQVYVLAGGSQWTSNANAQSLGAVSNLIINQSLPNAQIGELVVSPGDLNQDGYQDLLITAPQLGNATGQSYLVFGSSAPGAPLSLEGTGQTVDLSPTATDNKTNLLLNGSAPFQLTGQAAASAGLVNGNPSLLLSAPYANQLYTVYGHPWLADDGSLKLENLSGDNGFVIDGDLYAVSVATQIYNLEDQSSAAPALINNNGVFYLAYVENGGNQIYFTASADAGQTWDSPLQLPSGMTVGLPSSNQQTFNPLALSFYQGVLYLAYIGGNNEINITYSADNGQTWSDQYTFGQYSSQGVSLTVYQDQLMVFFVSTEADSDVSGSTVYDILYVYSDNPQASDSWSSKYTLANNDPNYPNQTANSAIGVTVLEDTLYLAYLGSDGSGYYVASTGGTTLNDLAWSVAEVSGAANAYTAPSLINDGQQIYLSYGSSDENAIYYLASDNGGNWSSLAEVPGQSSAFAPGGATLAGRLYLGYTGGTTDVYVTALAGTQTLFGAGNEVVMLGDINGDGFADLAVGGAANGALIVFGGSTQDLTSPELTQTLVITVSEGEVNLASITAAGDFNGDGFQDFGVLDANQNFYLVLGNGNLASLGSLSVDTSLPYTNPIQGELSVGDVNGDGYDDLILLGEPVNNLFLGNAGGTLDAYHTLSYGQERYFSVGDLNSDGYSDFVQTQSAAETSTNIGDADPSAFNELEIFWGGANLETLASQPYLTVNGQPFNGALNGQMAGGNGDFNGDGQADFLVSAAQPVALMVVETSNSAISYAYFDPLSVNWDLDSQVLLNLQTTTHTYSSSGDTMGVASYEGDWYFAHSEDYIFWLSGSAINQDGENQFGSEYDYGKPQLVTAAGNLYMIVAGWNSNNPYISQYNSETNAWAPPDPSTEYDSLTNSVTSTDGNDVVTAAVGNLIYLAWSHDSDLYYGYWDTEAFAFTPLGNPSLSSLGVSGDNNPLSMTAINGILYLALYDSDGYAWLTTYDTTATNPSWTAGAEILYTQGDTAVKAEENSVTLLGINGQLYVSWYDTAQITPQSQTDDTQYVFLTTTTNPTSANPTWSNSLLLYNTQAGAGLDITGNGDFPGLTPFVWTGMTAVLTNAQGGADNLVTLEGATLPLPYSTENPTLSNYGNLGDQVSFIGDINGDGYDDVLVNSPTTALSNQGTPDGAVFVIFGGPESPGNGTTFDLQNFTGNTQQITLVFSSNLEGNSLPSASAFTVANELNTLTVTEVTLSADNQLTLTLASAVNTSDFFSVSYGPPSSGNVLSYANGSAVGSFTASTDSAVATPGAPLITLTSYQDDGFMIAGLPASQAGISISGGADINGDSLSDFIIGAPGDDDNLTYAIFGSDFNQTVTQTGTIGADVMVGSSTGESFLGNQGNDQIYPNGGLDVVYAGPGDDLVTVTDTYFRRLDGGTGTDTLVFEGYNGQAWDLTALSPGLRLRDFEVLVTEGYGANLLTLNAVSVTQLSSNNTLVLFMDGTDTLNLSSDFSYSGAVYQFQQTFQSYQSSTSAARILLNPSGVTVTNTAPSVNTPAHLVPSGNVLVNASTEAGPPTEALAAAPVENLNLAGAAPQLYISNPNVSELTGTAEFILHRTGDLAQFLEVTYLTQDGDGKAGDRYIPTAGRLIFAPGESHKTVAVSIPNNGQYVGDRQFGLLATLGEESLDAASLGLPLSLEVAPQNEQVRRWNFTPGNGGEQIQFDLTTTQSDQGTASFDLTLDSLALPLIWNRTTQAYELPSWGGFNGLQGVWDLNGDSFPDQYHLMFQDGGAFDGDGVINGLARLDLNLLSLHPVLVPSAGGIVLGTEENNYISAAGQSGYYRLEGLGGVDVLIGSEQRDLLLGGDGSDQLLGRGGIEQLFGGTGDDLLDGGAALDFLYGGAGVDTFVLRAGDGPDRVMDFNPQEGDSFLLANLTFGA
ncbi:MAG: SwmB domain-containing protein, partial [Cyanobacteriota bacterium]